MIYFSIPGFIKHYELNKRLLTLKNTEPDKFYDDVIIDSIYDSFPGCIWNGGRRNADPLIPPKDISEIIRTFNLFNTSIRITFTNGHLTDNHLYDTLGNAILEYAKDSLIKTGININSDLLKQYIEYKYPNKFYYNWSATKCLRTVEDINFYSSGNDSIVPSYMFVNNNFKLLQQLEYPDKIELVVDENCLNYCPTYLEHYAEFDKEILCQDNYADDFLCDCYQKDNYYERRVGKRHNISIEEIREKYLSLGFNKFKIAGREELPFNLIESYTRYFVKPEWKDYIRNDLLFTVYV